MDEQLSQEQLAARLQQAAQKVAVGARYMHYKRLTYRVLLLALREEDNEPCVVYRAEYGAHATFTRPLASWLETVEVNGQIVPRFRKLSNDEQ